MPRPEAVFAFVASLTLWGPFVRPVSAEPSVDSHQTESDRSSAGQRTHEPRAPAADRARGTVEPRGTEPEDVALFVPRLVLSVPRYVLKLVFYPMVRLVELLDRHAVIENIQDILYNDARTAGVVPLLSVDTFFGPMLGARAFHDDLGGHGERVSFEAHFGGRYEQFYQLAFRADRIGGSNLWLEALTRFELERSLLFQGIGHPEAGSGGTLLDPREVAVETRFRQQRALLLGRLGATLGRPGSKVQFGMTGLFNDRRFDRPPGGKVPIERVYDTERLTGYRHGVRTLEANATLIVDTRDVAGATSSGVYFEAFAGGVPALREYHYWHHGFEATGYFNLYAKTRVLILRASLEGVEGSSSAIPFSDLPRLGGPHRLRGYPLDRFRDEKAALGTLEYHYPIHQYVAGSLHLDLGRVARSYSDLFTRDHWRVGAGGGFVVRSREKLLFTLDLAYGEALQVYLTTDPLRAFVARDTEL